MWKWPGFPGHFFYACPVREISVDDALLVYNPRMQAFKDHFSQGAADYRRFRPRYPVELFEFLASASPQTDCAWDCATGNGQVAVGLAGPFRQVLASDASRRQVAEHEADARIGWFVSRAEQVPLVSQSLDLLTVGQALHWFDFPRFFAEAARLLRRDGLLVAWCYELLRCSPEVDALIATAYNGILASCWPPERDHIQAGYRSIPSPDPSQFEAIEIPTFSMRADWRLQQLTGYLATWSASQRCTAEQGDGWYRDLCAALAKAWGKPEQPHTIHWPMSFLAFRRR